ncbi:MAG: ABC transporter ATP-binding protein [Actinomycetota bacterium]|nr:ABC transporter ATP-binding protein [Actinomycetota bacterium]
MTASIQASDLHFSYDSKLAVDGVTLEVAEGEILGFLGPNGAGKSTTIKMLTGQLKPDSGSIRLLDMDMSSDREEIQARMGVCFEEKNHYTKMTGRENLEFFGKLFGVEGLDAEGLLEKVDLVDRADDRVSSYSKGMRQRLMIARTISNRPDVLFFDEPTDGLDPISAKAIRSVIKEEASRGAAVLLTTHDMMEADTMSDRVSFINEGRVLITDTPENLKLAYGQRNVRVRSRNGGEVDEVVIPMDEEGAGERLRSLLTDEVMTIHTEEATLEDIFIQMAGRGLE